MRALGVAVGLAVGCSFVGCGSSAPAPVAAFTAQRLASYPAARYFVRTGNARPVHGVCVNLALPIAVQPTVAGWLSATGLDSASAGCDWTLTRASAMPSLRPAAAAVWASLPSPSPGTETGDDDNDERYIVVTETDPAITSSIYAASPRGLLHGMRAALAAVEPSPSPTAQSSVAPSLIVDGPSFAMRGVVEGFYGNPYTTSERTTTIACMGRLRQSRYVYGPKGDAYVHDRWADPYPADGAAALSAAAATAAAWSIDFVWAVAPGPLNGGSSTQSIQYSSDADFARLTAKIESVRALGVSQFGLLLDDITPTLVWSADQAAFPTLADAHRTLLNRLVTYLITRDPTARLLMVGTAYSSQDPQAVSYNTTLANGLLPAVDVMWTGPLTFSTTIAPSDLGTIDTILGRKVVLWDNYPLSVIPPTGRAPDLSNGTGGFLSNPMLNENGAHPIGDFWKVLGPLADYAWNSIDYDAAASFAAFNAQPACAGF